MTQIIVATEKDRITRERYEGDKTVELLDSPKRPTVYFPGLSGSGIRGSTDPNKLAPRLPTPFSETVGTSFDEAMASHSLATEKNLFDEYESYIAEIDEATGQRFSLRNPYLPENTFGGEPEKDRDTRIREFYDGLAAISQNHPNIRVRTHEDIISKVAGERQAVREQRELAAAGESGFASGIGAFIGGSAGAITDPLVLPTLFLGAPWSAGVLRFALTEAALGAGSTAVAEHSYQQGRPEIGEEPDYSHYLQDIALAAGGSALFGAFLKGGAKTVGAFRQALSDRRTRLAMAEALPPGMRTPDVEAAIAVERRMLDIEEANPLGRDLPAQSIHGQKYAAAERALAEGRILPRTEEIQGQSLSHLSEADRQVVEELRRIGNEAPDSFNRWVEALKKQSDEAVQQAETFTQFVQRAGSIDGMRSLGKDLDMTLAQKIDDAADILPLKKGGKTFDEIGIGAQKLGYFDHPPTADEIITAIADEVRNGKPTYRASLNTAFPVSLARQVGVLDRVGIPFRDLEPKQVAARLRALGTVSVQNVLDEMTSMLPGSPRVIRDIAEAEAANRVSARTDNARLDAEGEEGISTDLDAAREQIVRQMAVDNPDAMLTFENVDGSIERMTVREMLERNKFEAEEIDALRVCLFRQRG